MGEPTELPAAVRGESRASWAPAGLPDAGLERVGSGQVGSETELIRPGCCWGPKHSVCINHTDHVHAEQPSQGSAWASFEDTDWGER